MSMSFKVLMALTGSALTLIAFAPYIVGVFKGRVRPHVFSWVIWTLATSTVFLAQLAGGGGLGAWPIGVSGLVSFFVLLLSVLHRSDFSIHKIDWACLFLALIALPAWWVAQDPLMAVILLVVADLLGFGPTLRKSWYRPHEESLWFYFLIALRNIISIFALEAYNATTLLFPSAVSLACALVVFIVLMRGRCLSQSMNQKVNTP